MKIIGDDLKAEFKTLLDSAEKYNQQILTQTELSNKMEDFRKNLLMTCLKLTG